MLLRERARNLYTPKIITIGAQQSVEIEQKPKSLGKKVVLCETSPIKKREQKNQIKQQNLTQWQTTRKTFGGSSEVQFWGFF